MGRLSWARRNFEGEEPISKLLYTRHARIVTQVPQLAMSGHHEVLALEWLRYRSL